MDLRSYLTNELMRKKFSSQFELVNYAIKLAANMIHTGREEARVKIDSQNRAMQILSEILNGKDRFDEIIIEVAAPATYRTSNRGSNEEFEEKETFSEGPAKVKAKDKKKKLKTSL